MILDFLVDELGTKHGDFYTGVPIRYPGEMVISSQSNVAVVGGISNLGRVVTKKTRAIILMSNRPEYADLNEWGDEKIPVIHGQKIRLPRKLEATYGKSYVYTESSSHTWGYTSLVQEGESSFLVPFQPSVAGSGVVPVPDNLDIKKLNEDLNVRRWVAGFVGIPERLRIVRSGKDVKYWSVAINPTK